MATALTLLSNATATGSAVRAPAGKYAFAVDGTFSGATVTLSMLGPDGSSYISCGADAALTAEGAVLAELPDGLYKAVVTGGPPSAMYATLKRIEE